MRAVTTTKTRETKRAMVTKRARATRAMAEPSPREKGDDGLLRWRGYTTINY